MLNNASITRNRSPFTPTQWQELEHQALIYKYLDSGVPIPSELIFSVRRSLESSLASRIFPHQSIGWGCFQVGYGRKTDPEPGRCRRTDGKKWRCSKEAYPDSKYCERHMHRGRNRSRKPVELITSTQTTSTQTGSMPMSNLNPSPISINRNLNQQLSSSSPSPSPSANSPYSFSPLSSSPAESDLFHSTIRTSPYLYPHSSNSSSSSSSRPSPSASASTHNLFLDSGSSVHLDKDYRYFNGMREGSDERAFFPESSGNIRSLQDPYHSISMGTASYKSFSQSQFESLAAEATSKQRQQQEAADNDQQQQHCFVLGTDFKSSSAAATRPIKLEKEAETQKSLHHFFGEWPPKNSESWLDLSSTSTSRPAN